MEENKKGTGSQPQGLRLASPGEVIDTSIALYFEGLRAGGGWGLSTSIALEACEAETLLEEHISEFVKELGAAVLHMTEAGSTAITCCGEGYELVSFPGSLLIAAHISSRARNVALDLFGMVAYSPSATAQWCRKFFGSQHWRVGVALRGVRPRQMLSCLLML